MMFLKKAWDWICKNWWAAVGFFEAKSEFAKEEQEILEGASQEQREIAERYTDLIKRVAEENKVEKEEIKEEVRKELLEEAKAARENPEDFARRIAEKHGLNFVE
jgi:hypothetical protein